MFFYLSLLKVFMYKSIQYVLNHSNNFSRSLDVSCVVFLEKIKKKKSAFSAVQTYKQGSILC